MHEMRDSPQPCAKRDPDSHSLATAVLCTCDLDVTQKYIKMTKDAILEESSQLENKDYINRRNGQGLKHLKFFLLVFSKDETQAQLISFCNIFRIDSK